MRSIHHSNIMLKINTVIVNMKGKSYHTGPTGMKKVERDGGRINPSMICLMMLSMMRMITIRGRR
jgi:hypothetical protein